MRGLAQAHLRLVPHCHLPDLRPLVEVPDLQPARPPRTHADGQGRGPAAPLFSRGTLPTLRMYVISTWPS